MKKRLDWKPDLSMPVGKGATVQRFTANFGDERLEIDTEPWVEGDLKINGRPVARIRLVQGAIAKHRPLIWIKGSLRKRT